MPIASTDWFEQIKDYVHRAVGQNFSVVEGTVTSRQASPPSVKVMLEPYEVETGWIRVGTQYGGNGFGLLAIPPEGMAVKVQFDMGDKSSAVVVCDVWNDVDIAPTLNDVDDAVFIHSSGSKLYFHKNGDADLVPAGKLNIAGGGAAIARVGDAITAYGVDSHGDSVTVTGTITSGSSKVTSG
ncbi:phage baseplate assembly protein V [Desulfosporosinus sp. FKA]|uniref:phage baseplate assembly protein V n=1 Tax=Desulfosporosinus sp. FKA TaxID=1969834 RepID=UPI000B49E74D|nr:phage baseplate assembly protein V [Desulfosporosinus sp. FKA]